MFEKPEAASYIEHTPPQKAYDSYIAGMNDSTQASMVVDYESPEDNRSTIVTTSPESLNGSNWKLSPVKAGGITQSLLTQYDPQERLLFIPYLMLAGLMYCKATTRSKAMLFYQLCQYELQPHVSNQDRELVEYFYKNLEISTLYI